MLCYGYFGFYSFVPHIAVFLGLIALGFGYWISLQAKASTCCSKWGKFLGVFISVVAGLGLICLFYICIQRCFLAQKGDWHKNHMQMVMPPAGDEDKVEK